MNVIYRLLIGRISVFNNKIKLKDVNETSQLADYGQILMWKKKSLEATNLYTSLTWIAPLTKESIIDDRRLSNVRFSYLHVKLWI